MESLSVSSNFSAKRSRGRPPASGKRQNLASLGGGFTPYVITVNQGEEVMEKISSISKKGSWTACVLSANGSLYNATVRHPGSPNSIKYEGCFEIISLSGSFALTESNNGVRSKTSYMSVSMAGLDGHVFGGEVAGPLMAASPIQVVVGAFTLKCPKKSQKKHFLKPLTTTPASASNQRAEPTSNCHASGEEVTQVTQSFQLLGENLGEATFKSDSNEDLNCRVYDADYADCPNLLSLLDDC